MDFENKVVVVTGGAGGIGGAICTAFVDAGARVICVDVNREAGKTFVLGMRSRKHGSFDFLEMDVSDTDKVPRGIHRVINGYGRVDILVNNAAIQPLESYASLHLLNVDLWDKILDVNLKGYFLMARYCIPSMIEQGGGVIINIASVTGLAASKNISAYAASKAGIISLTRSIALEYGDKNIRSVAICPGTIDTPFIRRTLSAQVYGLGAECAKEKLDHAHPIGRIGMPEEIASAILFCAGSGASFMTGSVMTVDGGLLAKGAWEVE